MFLDAPNAKIIFNSQSAKTKQIWPSNAVLAWCEMNRCSFCIVRPRMHPSPGGNVVRPFQMSVALEIWVLHAGTLTSRMLQYGTHTFPFVTFPTVMPTLNVAIVGSQLGREASWAVSHNLQNNL